MAGYFGTELQVRLQKRSDERAVWSRTTPGAYNSARMLGSDDIDQLGWDTILEALEEDGVFGFRMLPASRAPAVSEKLAEHGYRIDFWETFMADRSAALEKVDGILARDLPADLTQLDMALPSDSATVRQVQEFILENGIAPFSGSMLVGEIGPAVTIALADAGGAIVATAHAYLPHNRHSAYQDAAWGGLVAVAASQRGRKLGTYVNAMMIRAAFDRLAAERIYELASATNIPSRKMIESCGLALVPTLKAAAVVASGAEKFTR